jgi:hypothetical protein
VHPPTTSHRVNTPKELAQSTFAVCRAQHRATGRETLENLTNRFPEIAASLRAAIGRRGAIVDGELVTLARDGRPNFTRLQRRLRVTRASTLLQREVPARFYLYLDSSRRF